MIGFNGIYMTEEDILSLIKKDEWMMSVLKTARSLHLPDWMIGAGFVRNKVWDYLHGYKNKEVPTQDIDLIYFDAGDLSEETEKEYDRRLRDKFNVNWSAKNQARMHEFDEREEQYKNTEEALSEWVETPTCVAVRLEENDALNIFAPNGIDDLVNLVVRPSPAHLNDLETFWSRIKRKEWAKKWPKLKFVES